MVEQSQQDREFPRMLRLLAPGTPLREALDSILHSRTGALIVAGDAPNLEPLVDGGFLLDCEFTPTKVYELAKMDGAIVLSGDLRRILRANVQLVPDSTIPSLETGIRHRTADRMARQTGVLILAISRRRNVITAFKGPLKYVLQETPVILAKANQALQTLERYRVNLDAALTHLTALEFEDSVIVGDVVFALQRLEMVLRVAAEITFYSVELGSEGRLVSLQLDELVAGAAEEGLLLLRDYAAGEGGDPPGEELLENVRAALAEMPGESLLEPERVAQALGYPGGATVLETRVTPWGYRILRKIPRLPLTVVENLVARLGPLSDILQADVSQLDEVEGIGAIRANAIRQGLQRIREQAWLPRVTRY